MDLRRAVGTALRDAEAIGAGDGGVGKDEALEHDTATVWLSANLATGKIAQEFFRQRGGRAAIGDHARTPGAAQRYDRREKQSCEVRHGLSLFLEGVGSRAVSLG